MKSKHKDVPQLSEKELLRRYQSDISISPTRFCRSKRWLDLLVAGALAAPAALIIGLLVVLVRRTSDGPGIFKQKRVGLHGRVFTIYKLRSMHIDAERRLGPAWASKNDPRVTRLGYWLRKLHLDELPQVYNVLKGDMSLVGPRPERPEFVSLLCKDIDGYMNRLAVRPGVTGLAQINLPPDSGWDSARSKQVLDLEYIERGGLMLDLRMMMATALRIIGLKGDWVTWLMRLKHVSSVDRVEEVGASSKPTSMGELASMAEAPEDESVLEQPVRHRQFVAEADAIPNTHVQAAAE